MPACPYLSISWYKTTNCTFQISIELLLKFLIQKSLSLIFSQQYSQVLLNEDERETKEKMKNNYINVITYILKIHFFSLFVGYDRTTKVR